MNRVFVLDRNRRPLMPCHPARARQLLKTGRAAVYKRAPFTIVLKERAGGAAQPVAVKLDPGAKVTGLALVATFQRGARVVWAGELAHRGEAIRAGLTDRRSFRRGRRGRKTRYRAARFLNRTRPAGWLPPSLQSRVDNVTTWVRRLRNAAPIATISLELVKFDTQALQNPEIQGVEYQQGTLQGYEVREYLLEKWGRCCAYCGATGVPLQIEHIHPKSRDGTDRISNLTLACEPCNVAKNAKPVEVFLAHDPERLKKLLAQAKAPLKDAAAVNSTRWALYRALQVADLPVETGSGGRTKYNRTGQNYSKAHWIDAACVGPSGERVHLDPEMKPLEIKATGRGQRRVTRPDRYGFPRTAPGRVKRARGFSTGDLVRLEQPAGKYAGVYTGRLAGIRADGRFDLKTARGKITAPCGRYTLLQRADGYAYAQKQGQAKSLRRRGLFRART